MTPRSSRQRGKIAKPPKTTGAAAPEQTPADPETAAHQARLSQMEGNLAQLRQHLEALEAERDTIEAKHVERAQSPLALRLELVGCQLAAEVWSEDTGNVKAGDIPQFVFGPDLHCWKGLTQPNQDCRDCIHHKIIPLDTNKPAFSRRYPRYSPIIALTQDDADKLAAVVHAMGLEPLRRVDAEIKAVKQAIERTATQAQTTRNQIIERQQRGQL